MTRGFIPVIILSIILSSFSLTIVAQSKTVTLTDAIDLAVQKNKQLESYRLKAEQSRKLKAEAFDPGSTGIYYSYDENNIAENNLPLKVLGVEQSFDFPTVYLYRLRAARTQVEVDNLIFDISRNELTKKVSQAYYKVILIQSKIRHLRALDSLYEGITTAADLRYRTGESNYLQLLTSRVRAMQMKTRNVQITEDLKNELQKFQALIQMDIMIQVPSEEPGRLEIKYPDFDQHFGVMMFDEMQKLSQDRLLVEKNRLLPAISLQYFQGTNKAENAKIYPGFQVGISLPVFFGAQNARIQAAKIEKEISAANALNYVSMLKSRAENIMSDIRKYDEVLKQYEELGKKTADEIIKYARLAYEQGDIDFHTYFSSLEEAINIELDYLDNLDGYNQAVLELNYLNL